MQEKHQVHSRRRASISSGGGATAVQAFAVSVPRGLAKRAPPLVSWPRSLISRGRRERLMRRNRGKKSARRAGTRVRALQPPGLEKTGRGRVGAQRGWLDPRPLRARLQQRAHLDHVVVNAVTAANTLAGFSTPEVSLSQLSDLSNAVHSRVRGMHGVFHWPYRSACVKDILPSGAAQ